MELIDRVKAMVARVNQECFSNQLTINFPIKICNTSRSSAYVMSRKILGYDRVVTSLSVSKNYDWTEEQLQNTVAHELIHVYEIQILKQDGGHRYPFLKEMSRINQIPGYSVKTKHSMKSTKLRRAVAIISADRTKLILVSSLVITRSVNEMLVRIMGENYQVETLSATSCRPYIVSPRIKRSYRVTEGSLASLGLFPKKMAA